MISVQNHPLQLSGNKIWSLLFICYCLGACSPKAITGKLPNKKTDTPTEKNTGNADTKFTEANIALLLPFNLPEKQQLKSLNSTTVEKSTLALDFYQGFKMGIDSAAAEGMNFHVNVIDTRNNTVQISNLLKSGRLLGNHLIIGPVFPEGIKTITNYSIAQQIPVVSPLAASHPDEFNNPNLISLVNNIDLHAGKYGDFIKKEYDSEKTVVVLINPKKGNDEILGGPIRNYFQMGKGSSFTFQEYASVYTMETKLIPAKQYVVLISSADRQFVVATLDKLLKMKKAGLSIDLFGHPNWIKQNYATEKLQLLNTRISSSYHVDYKSSDVIMFIRNYRKLNQFEPGEYAFKGFDTGYYFGKLLARYGANYLKDLTNYTYKGLHNSFSFVKKDKLGYINTHLFLLEYKNYDLKAVEQ